MKTENAKSTATSMTPTRPCVPEDHKCNPTDCIPLSVAEAQLETVCVPDICDPAVKCAPQRDAVQASPGSTQLGPCIPTSCGPDIPCTPEARGRGVSQSTQAATCVPDMNCDPGDVWSKCGPYNKGTTAGASAQADPCLPQTCSPSIDRCGPYYLKSSSFLWLDLTRKCQLECTHCYNSSGPDGDHGSMEREDWLRVLDEAKAAAVGMVQLIGGEPTMHPDFTELVEHALRLGIEVEVYSNLVHISDDVWELFRRPGVSLATSYYSDSAAEHNKITKRPSHAKTLKNIKQALAFGIPLRAGIVDVSDGQRYEQAVEELKSLGVERIGVDRVRHFGRGQETNQACNVSELCGNCGDQRAAIGPDGSVTPCIMSSWLTAGNVQDAPLAGILSSPDFAAVTTSIRTAVGNRIDACDPPDPCNPRDDGGACNPGTPPSDCGPRK